MPSDRPLLRFEDILDNIARIERCTERHDAERFTADQQCQDAVERCLFRISEAARKLGSTAETLAPDQPWAAIRDVGSVLRHDYDDVSPAIIWQIVVGDLPALKRAVETTLAKLPRDAPDS